MTSQPGVWVRALTSSSTPGVRNTGLGRLKRGCLQAVNAEERGMEASLQRLPVGLLSWPGLCLCVRSRIISRAPRWPAEFLHGPRRTGQSFSQAGLWLPQDSSTEKGEDRGLTCAVSRWNLTHLMLTHPPPSPHHPRWAAWATSLMSRDTCVLSVANFQIT